jgi:type IV pilus assembly protein PilX
MNRHLFALARARHQNGAVLFVALVFLILVTLLALTATSTSILQEKMTGGMRNRQLGLMGAESALRGGEAYFSTATFNGINPLPACGAASQMTLCAANATSSCNCAQRPVNGRLVAPIQEFRTKRGWAATPVGAPEYVRSLTGFTGDEETASLASEPVYVIEDLGADVPPGAGQQKGIIDPEQQNSAWFYRVTSRSQGGSGAVVRVAESVYSPGLNLANAGANTGTGGTP